MLGGNSGKSSGSSGNKSKVNQEGGSTSLDHIENLYHNQDLEDSLFVGIPSNMEGI
jgi:hypothetical protein